MTRNIGRRLAIAMLVAAASPLSPEVGSAQEPLARQPVVAPVAEPAESHVMLVEAGKAVTAADLQRSFVVVRRRDGRVPRAWLWDEPLGCPKAVSASR